MMAKALILLLISLAGANPSAFAHEEMSDEFKSAISKDLEANFAEKMSSVALHANAANTILSARDEKVMLRALYAGISGPLSMAGVQLSEQSFYEKVGQLLVKGAQYGVLPAALTVGWYGRADLIVGKTFGTEMNFYLENGALKVSTYDLKTLSVGADINAKVGYYVALCFGSCFGGDAQGTYVGVDADVVYGAGANFYIEVGVDTTDYYKAKKMAEHYALSDLYAAKAVYLGAGVDVGLGFGLSANFTDYELTSDYELIDLYSIMNAPDFGARVRSAFNHAHLFDSAPRF